MYKTRLLLVIFFSPLLAIAQKNNPNVSSFFIAPAFESLYSTHGNFFYSGSIKVSKIVDKKTELGIGVEKVYSPIHHDNGFVLYHLHFMPVYGNMKYYFRNSGKWRPFVESSLGVSFNKYKIASDESPTVKSRVKEIGIFIYEGAGIKYSLSKNISLVTALGFKGYKMSFNVYDINPHGASYMLGVVLN